ncbi:MAG: Mut7-C RNAse domain-containing protein [Candidatus Bilamarchaeaceae archaeon]
MKLLFDEMLEKTARWCRIFGVDSDLVKGPDEKILKKAKKSKRVLVTRDKQLAQICVKKDIPHILISSIDVLSQLKEITMVAGKEIFHPEKTRCPKCNSLLFLITKNKARYFVPLKVLEHHRKFWFCRKCKHVYWHGGHWKNINKIKRKLLRNFKR